MTTKNYEEDDENSCRRYDEDDRRALSNYNKEGFLQDNTLKTTFEDKSNANDDIFSMRESLMNSTEFIDQFRNSISKNNYKDEKEVYQSAEWLLKLMI